jgi:hypothetical protein
MAKTCHVGGGVVFNLRVDNKNMKTFAQKTIGAGVGIFLAASVASYGDVLYNDSTTDTGNSLSFVNNQALGQELIINNGSPFASVTSFSFDLYIPTAYESLNSATMEVYLYSMNGGVDVNGDATPGTVDFDSGSFTLSSASAVNNVEQLTFDLTSSPYSPATVPYDFTLAMVVNDPNNTGLGVELYSPATVGGNYGVYWLDNGGWDTYTNNAIPHIEFGTVFSGTPTPEPSVIYLGSVGMMALLGAVRLRRKK